MTNTNLCTENIIIFQSFWGDLVVKQIWETIYFAVNGQKYLISAEYSILYFAKKLKFRTFVASYKEIIGYDSRTKRGNRRVR